MFYSSEVSVFLVRLYSFEQRSKDELKFDLWLVHFCISLELKMVNEESILGGESLEENGILPFLIIHVTLSLMEFPH